MTELMKRYEAETGKDALVFNPSGMNPSNEYVAFLETEVKATRITLKAQLTWRPVSENPRKEGWIFCHRKAKCICGCGEVGIIPDALRWLIAYQTWEEFVEKWNVIDWLPIPPAPEGEVK